MKLKIILSILIFIFVIPLSVNSLQIEDYEIFTLPSGIKVFLFPQTDEILNSIQLWVKAGTEKEDYKIRGAGKLTALYLESFFDENINTICESDWISFQFLSNSHDMNSIFKQLKNNILKPEFTEERFQNTKARILEEISFKKIDTENVLRELKLKTLFKNLPYRHPVNGYKNTINNLSLKEMKTFYDENYPPENMILLIMGNFDNNDIKKTINKIFINEKINKINIKNISHKKIYEPPLSEIRESCIRMEISRMHANLSWWYPQNDKNRYSAYLLNILLNKKPYSLYNKFKKEFKLVHSIKATTDNFQQGGIFSIHYILKPRNAYKTRENILRLLTDLRIGKITEQEFLNAKKIGISQHIFNLDNLEKRNGLLGMAIIEKQKGKLEFEKNINNLTLKDLNEFLKKYIMRKAYSYTYILPKNKKSGKKRR